jgi:hypothetical protein
MSGTEPEVRFLATRVVFTAQHKDSTGKWTTFARGDIDYSGFISLDGDASSQEWSESFLENYEMAQRVTFGPQGGEESEVFADSAFLSYFANALRNLPQGWQPWRVR